MTYIVAKFATFHDKLFCHTRVVFIITTVIYVIIIKCHYVKAIMLRHSFEKYLSKEAKGIHDVRCTIDVRLSAASRPQRLSLASGITSPVCREPRVAAEKY